MEQYDFEEIRPYRDHEVNAVLRELIQEPVLLNALPMILPDISTTQLAALVENIHSNHEFQMQIILPLMNGFIRKTTQGVEMLGLGNIDKTKGYLFISNHRDIVLDSAFLNTSFLQLEIPLSEIAIGDNLLIAKWIKDVVRLNRSFIVNRSTSSPRQFLENSKRLSAYIRHTLTTDNRSVWIAQREGRAKDSDDRTQEALLKMLNMSGEKNVIENLAELSVCPLAIAYEYDPCDYLKAKEFQQKRDNADYRKSPQDDLLNMKTGIFGDKGQVVYYFAGDIRNEILAISSEGSNAEQLAAVARLIDRHIHRNYAIFANNRVAYDLLLETDRFAHEYDLKEKSAFETYLQMQLDKIDLPDKDEAFLRRKILEMYANPLINQLKTNS